MSLPNIAPLVLDLILSRLAPWFLAATADPQAARDAASLMLASYGVETEAEAHLAAEAICLSFGVLEALGRSVDPDLPLNAVLRLRGSANAMHRSAHKSQSALQALRKQRQSAQEAPVAAHPDDQAQATPSPQKPEPPKPAVLSRQQRRALERSREKARRQQAEQARRDALRARRADATPPQPAIHEQGFNDGISTNGGLKPLAALVVADP